MKQQLPCVCENVIEVDIPDQMDASADSALVPSILDGSFLSFRCETCGKILKPEFRLSILHLPGEQSIYYIPEIERNGFLSGRIDTPSVDRVVIGFRELVEKVQIFQDGLDDRVIEIAKSRLLKKAPEDGDTEVYYCGIEDQAAVFHIYGLRDGEIGVVRVPIRLIRHITDDLPAILTSEAAKSVLSGPYVSLRNVDFEEIE